MPQTIVEPLVNHLAPMSSELSSMRIYIFLLLPAFACIGSHDLRRSARLKLPTPLVLRGRRMGASGVVRCDERLVLTVCVFVCLVVSGCFVHMF